MFTSIAKKDIGKKIIDYLLNKKDHKDDLDGITLFIYENELKNLAEEISTVVNDMLNDGLITECQSISGKKYYQLSDDKKVISDLL